MRLGIALLLMLVSIIGLIIPLYELISSGVLQGLLAHYGTSMLVLYVLGLGYFILLNVLPLRYRPKVLLNALSILFVIGLIALGVITELHWIFSLGAVVITFIGWRLLAIAHLLRCYFKAMREYEDLGDLELLNQALLRIAQQKCAQSLWINVSGYVITFRAFLHLVVPFKLAFDGDSLNILRLQQQSLELFSRNMLSTLGDPSYNRWAQNTEGDVWGSGLGGSSSAANGGSFSLKRSSKFRVDDHLEQDYMNLINNMVQATAWLNRQKERHGLMGMGRSAAAAEEARAAGLGSGVGGASADAFDESLEGSYKDEQDLDREIDARMADCGQKVTASDKLQLKLVVKMLWALSSDNPRVQKSAAPPKFKRLVDFELGSAVMSFQGVWRLGQVRHNLSLLWPIACITLVLFSLWGLLRLENVNAFFAFTGAYTDSLSLLESYNLWFLLLLLVISSGLLLMLEGIVFMGLDVSRYFASLKLQVVLCAFYVFLVGSMLLSGNVVSLFFQVHSDLNQAQQGIDALERSEVFLSPRVLVTNLGEPFPVGFYSVRRFHGFSTQHDNVDDYYLVPRDVWLPWDQIHVYQEERSRSWNYEHACHYLLYHTSNLNLVLFAKQIQFDHREQESLENQAVPLRDSRKAPSHISRQTLDELIKTLQRGTYKKVPQVPTEHATTDGFSGSTRPLTSSTAPIKAPEQSTAAAGAVAPAALADAPEPAADPERVVYTEEGAVEMVEAESPEAEAEAEALDEAVVVDENSQHIILPSLQDRYRAQTREDQLQSAAAQALDEAYQRAQETNTARKQAFERQHYAAEDSEQQ